MKRASILCFIIIFWFKLGRSQMGEFFQVIDSIKISSIEIKIAETVKDSVTYKLSCLAYYSGNNRLDSILCEDYSKTLVSKYIQTFHDNGYIFKTIYFNKEDDLELYRTEKFIYGKESSLEYSNNKNDKGYKLTTTYDDCCIESGNLWHVNDTLTIKQIIENIYDKTYSCNQFCARSAKNTFNPYNSIYLIETLPLSYFDNQKAAKFKEEYMGKQYVSLNGDTIVITKTDSNSYLSQTKRYTNDDLNFSELIKKTLKGYGADYNIKYYDTKYSLRREDLFNFKGSGSEEGVKFNISITNQFGTIDYHGQENTPIQEMQRIESNKKSYEMDKNKNWVMGIFEKSENRIITVTRRINYS